MQDKPKISIISPSKNTGRFAKETIESILKQSYPHWEHIVVDGGSTDETLDVIKQYPHIRLISGDDSGPDEAFRTGLAMAKGEYVMLCCISDGYLDKNWFKKCVDVLDNQHEISLVWGIDQNMLEDGTLHQIVFNSWFQNPLPSGTNYFHYWVENGTLFHERDLCVRKYVIEKCFPPFDINMVGKESAFLTFIYNFNIFGYLSYFIPTLAAYGRIHSNAVSQNQERSGGKKAINKYYTDYKQYKREILKGNIDHYFRDGSGKLIQEKYNINKYHKLILMQNRIKKYLVYLIPPIIIWFKDKLVARYSISKYEEHSEK